MTGIDILVPTYERPAALAVTLTSLCFQTRLPDRILIADQSAAPARMSNEISAVVRLLHLRGVTVEFMRNLPRRGLAQQRQFLLENSIAPLILFLDDDLILESWVIEQMATALRAAGCGFVGSAVIGLSFSGDRRPDEQAVEFWNGAVVPEALVPDGPEWARHRLHNAANLLHVQQRLAPMPADSRLYKVAWVGGCVMYDRAKLIAAGGFDFWRRLPEVHVGEDVEAQRRVMARFGGAGIMPSGVYHQELPTTVADRSCDAPHVLTAC